MLSKNMDRCKSILGHRNISLAEKFEILIKGLFKRLCIICLQQKKKKLPHLAFQNTFYPFFSRRNKLPLLFLFIPITE